MRLPPAESEPCQTTVACHSRQLPPPLHRGIGGRSLSSIDPDHRLILGFNTFGLRCAVRPQQPLARRVGPKRSEENSPQQFLGVCASRKCEQERNDEHDSRRYSHHGSRFRCPCSQGQTGQRDSGPFRPFRLAGHLGFFQAVDQRPIRLAIVVDQISPANPALRRDARHQIGGLRGASGT